MKQATKPAEPYADAVARLLQKAKDERIQLFMDGETEDWFATSATMDGVIYRVSEVRCSCQGFRSFNRCKHFSLFLEQFGKRPPTEAEIEAARVEWERMQSLLSRHQLKSTGDWRHFQTVKATYTRMLTLVARSGYEPQTAA